MQDRDRFNEWRRAPWQLAIFRGFSDSGGLKPPRTFLIVMSAILGGAACVGLVPALTSFFLFDAPGSEKNPATIVLFCCALSFPLVCLIAIAVSWILFGCQQWKAACWTTFLPVVNLLGGAAALLFLELFNEGRFN